LESPALRSSAVWSPAGASSQAYRPRPWLTRRQDRFASSLLDPATDRERVAAERAQLIADFVKSRKCSNRPSSSAGLQSLASRCSLRVPRWSFAQLPRRPRPTVSVRFRFPAPLQPRRQYPPWSALRTTVRSLPRVFGFSSMWQLSNEGRIEEPKSSCGLWAIRPRAAATRTALASGSPERSVHYGVADGPTAVVVASALYPACPIQQPDKAVVGCCNDPLSRSVFTLTSTTSSHWRRTPSLALARFGIDLRLHPGTPAHRGVRTFGHSVL
jgi:hypothetical protein